MDTQVIAALIALGGVTLSVLISWLTSQRQAKLEIGKYRAEIQKAFGGKLYEKKVELYPSFYSILSHLIKIIRTERINLSIIEESFKQLQKLDNTCSIFFNKNTINKTFVIRRLLFELTKKTEEELQKHFESEESRTELVRKLQEAELALKHELGIFAFESPIEYKEVKLYESYKEVGK